MWRIIAALLTLALLGLALLGCEERESNGSMTVADLLPDRIDGWTLGDSATTYDRETIFDYIDGAGEVYRSYAFSRVAVATYSSPQRPDITVEIFDMGNPADAYGVFSYAREGEQTGIGGGYERRGRVLCFWQNRYYVCLAAEERTADSDRTLLEVARAVSKRLPPGGDPPDLVGLLPAEGRVRHSERFFHLHPALNYHYYLARENVLDLSPETDAVLARYDPGSTYLLLIRYPNASDADAALASFRQRYLPAEGGGPAVRTESGKFVAHGSRDRFVVVVLDAESGTAAADLLQATLNRLSQPSG